ncbi:polysaccharide biosynthesis C-terminal domain-containing protein [Haliea sp. E1-2-M8]|uniref:lipopolysaccharide biosynthesis protein n=1 Tax=Haliea sp. E1-2-M8 TaxID=3064706 RepID=UPI00271EED47|nr:polysaccharide biosynthesis C-terminal domain-containing protein [Haliea sp. E1-2-M8]MDO8862441.1 polysaccharide biosynthesis C-terminal domain-containing protein [Haliea sp. E1-2-M8]
MKARLLRGGRLLGRSEVLRSSAVAAVIRAVGLAVVFLLQILLARLAADATTYGVYAWGQNLLFLLGTLFALGIPMMASRLAAVHVHRGDYTALRQLSRNAHGCVIVISCAGAGAGLLIVWSLPAALFTELPRAVVSLALLASPLLALILLRQALARAASRLFSAFVPIQVLRPLLTGLLALGAFLLVQRPLTALDILTALALSLLLVLLAQLLWEGARPPLVSAAAGSTEPAVDPAITADTTGDNRDTTPGAADLLRQSMPVFATRVADIVMTYGNTLLLGLIGGPLAAASFFVADRLAQLAGMPGAVTSAVIQPWLASAHAEGDRARLQRVVTQAAHVSLWPSVVAAALLFTAGPWLLALFGGEFAAALPVLVALLLAQLCAVLFGHCQQVLVMSGHQQQVMRLTVLAAALHLLVLAVLIPVLGALGAALASIASSLLLATGCWWLVRRQYHLRTTVF